MMIMMMIIIMGEGTLKELESRNFFEDFERRSRLFWDISRDKKILLNLKGKTWQLNCEFISNKS